MPTPVIVPELGAVQQTVWISSWLVEAGETVVPGDRLVELLVDGVTFDLPAPASGILAAVERGVNAVVQTGDVVGWISETAEPL